MNTAAAAASTCAAKQYYYAGDFTNNTISSDVEYDGVEGLINTDSLYMPNGPNSGHDASYVNNSTVANDCDTKHNALCWSQVGYLIGNGQSSQEVYAESDYYGGYQITYFPESKYNITASGTDNNLYQDYLDSSGQEAGGNTDCDGQSGLGQFRGTLDFGGGIYSLETSWLDGFWCTAPSAVNEDYVSDTGACPFTPSEQYFGATAAGGVSPSYPMSLSYEGNFNGSGYHWFTWSAANTDIGGHQYTTQVADSPPYVLTPVANYQTYGIYGS